MKIFLLTIKVIPNEDLPDYGTYVIRLDIAKLSDL